MNTDEEPVNKLDPDADPGIDYGALFDADRRGRRSERRDAYVAGLSERSGALRELSADVSSLRLAVVLLIGAVAALAVIVLKGEDRHAV
jgi:hypothetical protein